MQDNPFSAPDSSDFSSSDGVDVVDGAAVPLHDVGSVMLGAFLGGVLGGSFMLYQNARALGDPQPLRFVGIGAALTVLVALLAGILPEQVPGIVFTLGAVFGCRAWAESVQGAAIRASEVPRVSRWKAAGWALLMLIPTALISLVVLLPIVILLEG